MSTIVLRRARTVAKPVAQERIPAEEIEEPASKPPARRSRPATTAAPVVVEPANEQQEEQEPGEAGSSRTDYDGICEKYRASATNRRNAIRAMCVICMGGMIQEVAKCTSTQCPLFQFRMGKNPNDARTIEAEAKAKARKEAEAAPAAAAAKPPVRRPARRK